MNTMWENLSEYCRFDCRASVSLALKHQQARRSATGREKQDAIFAHGTRSPLVEDVCQSGQARGETRRAADEQVFAQAATVGNSVAAGSADQHIAIRAAR